MKVILSLMLLLAICSQVFSQSDDLYSIKFSANIPNSPEAINFSKFGIIPVTLYSGMPNVSVPLYEIHEGNIKVPITLSYYSKGFKPSEVSANTGLGWSLQSGGIITRIVRGQVDENPIMTDVYNYNGVADLKMKFEDFPEVSQMRYSQKILKEISTVLTDGEADIHTFNFNGYSGNFIIRNNEAILIPKQNIK